MTRSESSSIVGRVIGTTGGTNVTVGLRNSFSVKRGGFVRVLHTEEEDESPVWVLARVTGFSRENLIFSNVARAGADVLSMIVKGETGERNIAQMELIGYRDPVSKEIRIPRRALDPGAKVHKVDSDFLNYFYEYVPATSIKLGNLIGYERGPDSVPVYLDVNRMVTEHVAVLAMTGAGKSYTVGRICELLLTRHNASIVVFDPHGEYGKAMEGGKLRFGHTVGFEESIESELNETKNRIEEMMKNGGGIMISAPQTAASDRRYLSGYSPLSLRVDSLGLHELMDLLPEISPAQRRVLHPALRYWTENYDSPLYISDLLDILLTDEGFGTLKEWSRLPEGERKQLRRVSASIVGTNLKQLVESAPIFLKRNQQPLRAVDLIGRLKPKKKPDTIGRISIVDLSGLPKPAMQAAVAIILSEILRSRIVSREKTRPVFIVLEEAHIFSPSTGPCVSTSAVRRIASEGRKFGIGLCLVSQRPGKLHPDTLSQCNTLITMRIKNPDDQRFIRSTSDYFSESDLRELPTLSTGEALVCGRAILTSLIAKVGRKTLVHGGESPDVCETWRSQKV